MRLVAGLRPDPLEELTTLHQPPTWIRGRRKGEGKEGKREGRKGEGPPNV